MGRHLHVITWARWKVTDPFSDKYYSIFTASILKPTWQYPIACATMAISKGRQKVFMRLPYEALKEVFVIPQEYQERLEEGYQQAQTEALEIQKQQKALWKMSNLANGSHVVRTDTGEIIAEAERIMRESGTGMW